MVELQIVETLKSLVDDEEDEGEARTTLSREAAIGSRRPERLAVRDRRRPSAIFGACPACG